MTALSPRADPRAPRARRRWWHRAGRSRGQGDRACQGDGRPARDAAPLGPDDARRGCGAAARCAVRADGAGGAPAAAARARRRRGAARPRPRNVRALSNRWSSNGRSMRSSRCRSCSRGCWSRCRRRSNARIAARRRSGSISAWSIGRHSRACCSCRRRCAIPRCCGRCCCSISSRIRRRPAIDVVTIEIDPAPARIIQYSLLERAVPSVETLATLTARLRALVGDARCGSPSLLETHRPDAFEMRPFAPESRATRRRAACSSA